MTSINHALSVRSDHSIGESIMQIDMLVERAKALGFKSIALVDTMSISAMVPFTNKCKKEGIKPVVGCTLRVYDDPTYRKPSKASGEKERKNPFYQLKVYVKNDNGLRSLMKLLSRGGSAEYFYYHSRVGLEDVMQLEDVIVTTGDLFNVFHHPRHMDIINMLMGKFETYIEYCPVDTPLFDTLNAKALAAAKHLSTAYTIVGYPFMYGEADDADTLDVLRAITSNGKMDSRTLHVPFTRDWCFDEPKMLVERAVHMGQRIGMDRADVKRLLTNMNLVVDGCEYEFKKLEPCLPKMAEDEFLKLVTECKAGWHIRFAQPVLGHQPKPEEMPTYKARLAYELGVLQKLKFANYFLVVQDIVNWSKANGVIVGPGRGSCFLPGHHVVCDKSGVTKAIEDFSVGDTVLAHDGSTQEVIATLEFDRDEEIIELEFSNGIKIECTKDHKFFTRNRGWVIAEELCGEDEFDDVSELAERLESASPSSA